MSITTKGWNTKLDFIPLSKFIIDESYQRELRVAHANDIAANFNENSFFPLIVAPRANGMYAVTDGQNRLYALKKLGFAKAPCYIINAGTVSKEADSFLQQAEGTAKLTSYDRFKAAVQGNRKLEVEINSILTEMGFKLSSSSSTAPRTIQSVRSLMSVYKQHGEDGLRQTLKILSDAWGTEHVFIYAPVITGIAAFVKVFAKYENFSITRLSTALSKTTPEAIVIKAQPFKQVRKTTDAAIIEALIQTYNYKNRVQKLPERG